MERRPTRRDFIGHAAVALPVTRSIRLRLGQSAPSTIRVAVIADLHYGIAPDALARFDEFLAAVARRADLDAVWQLGDFCYSDDGATPCLERWQAVRPPRFGVLGNHDMDRVDKATAIAAWGLPDRHYAAVIGGWRFVVLDLNHYRRNGELHAYARGNYFEEGVSHNWADPAQLAWLDRELRTSAEPVVLVSHQPIGLGVDQSRLPEEQRQVLEVVTAAGRDNPRGRVVCCLSGHLHVDRLEWADGLPCLSVNSASYFWSNGMHPYSSPLFAFMELGAEGVLRVDGREGVFRTPPPADSDSVAGRSASIQPRVVKL